MGCRRHRNHGCRHPLRRGHAGARRARRRERRRMAPALLYRRDRRAGARFYTRDQSRRRPAVDRGDGEACAQAGGLHRRRGGVREEGRHGRHQDHPAGAGPAGRAAVGPRAVAEGLSRARRFRARLRGAAQGRDRAAPGHGCRHRADRRSAPLSVRRSRRAPSLRRSRPCRRLRRGNDQRDGRRLLRHQIRRASLPPGRGPGARREAPCRDLRPDPGPAQPPPGAASHHGVHGGRRRRSRELSAACARISRSGWASSTSRPARRKRRP